jgi:hypothetical protein
MREIFFLLPPVILQFENAFKEDLQSEFIELLYGFFSYVIKEKNQTKISEDFNNVLEGK